MKYFFSAIFILMVLPILAQNPLEIKIETITFSDTTSIRNYLRNGEIEETKSIAERKFTVNFHIKNTSDKTIRFYYNDAELENLTFNVYQENKIVAAFLYKESERDASKYYLGAPPETEEIIEKPEVNLSDPKIERIFQALEPGTKLSDIPELFIDKREILRNSLFSLSPGQEWQFTQIFYWNKNQPNRTKNHQGYIDPGFPHYLVFSVKLGKYAYQYWMHEVDFDKIKDDESFVEGIFTSEKAAINFD
ncbi:hypothetical protein [Flavobacterium sp. 3HN19-14]|uniref:hypothetical protein n=1 Tax=Flavobacterium sp. 3HN19-14 TaxID=3448133 RepID=UPI003EE34CEC